jgi:hypothetical protein
MKSLMIVCTTLLTGALSSCTRQQPAANGSRNLTSKDEAIETIIASKMPFVEFYNDGGTKKITTTDEMGTLVDVFFDYRVSVLGDGTIAREGGTVYLYGYPGTSNAVLVPNEDEFIAKLLNDANKHSNHGHEGTSDPGRQTE